MTPLLSVVVPVHSIESYVEPCLRSLTTACLPVEVIAIDDASTDSSLSVLSRFPLVRTVSLSSRVGLGAARNVGLSLSTGTYVWFVDGDDLLPAGALPLVMRHLSSDPDVLLVGHALTSGPDPSSVPSVPYGMSSVRSCPSLLRVRQAAWNRIVRVDLLRRTGVLFPDGLYEDVPFSHLVLAAAARVAVLPSVCYLYRTRDGSLTHSVSPRHFDVFTQYERLFATLSMWRASPRLLARLHAVMLRHYVAILGAPARVPPALRRAFFDRMVSHDRRYRPAVGPPLPASALAVRLGSYDAYLLGHLAKRVWSWARDGKDLRMTSTEPPPDVVDDEVTDVLTEDEVVHVSPAAAELAETLEHEHVPTFPADVPDWDADDPLPSA
jgi:glycosyltransferase involved in cell wall biosynthesis